MAFNHQILISLLRISLEVEAHRTVSSSPHFTIRMPARLPEAQSKWTRVYVSSLVDAPPPSDGQLTPSVKDTDINNEADSAYGSDA